MARKITGTIYKRGGVYWLTYKINGERVQMSLDTGDAKEAERRRARFIAPLSAGDKSDKAKALAIRAADLETQLAVAVEAARDQLIVAKAWDAFVSRKSSRPDSGALTMRMYQSCWEKFCVWLTQKFPKKLKVEIYKQNEGERRSRAKIRMFTGELRMEEITPEIVTEFANGLGDLTGNRYNKILSTGRLIYRCLAPLVNGVNPFEGVRPRPLETERHRELTETELTKVCSTAKGELRTLLALGLYCGFRVADAAQLQWHEVDLHAGLIVRAPSKVRRRTGKRVAVPIHATLHAILEETPFADRSGPVLPGFCASYKRDTGAAIAKAVREHFEACGIKSAESVEGRGRAVARATFHSLRHSMVSALARRGASLAGVRELVGHASESIQRAYLHTRAEDMRQAVSALPSFTAPPDPEKEKVLAIRKRLVELLDVAPFDALEKIEKFAMELAIEKQGKKPKTKDVTKKGTVK